MARGFRSARGKRELGFAHSIRFRVLRVGRRVRASCDGQEVARGGCCPRLGSAAIAGRRVPRSRLLMSLLSNTPTCVRFPHTSSPAMPRPLKCGVEEIAGEGADRSR
jgi:hypothetical protein